MSSHVLSMCDQQLTIRDPCPPQMGFFAEAGPVQIFVSNHLIPEDFEFSALDDPCYVSSDEEVGTCQHCIILSLLQLQGQGAVPTDCSMCMRFERLRRTALVRCTAAHVVEWAVLRPGP